MGMHISFIAAKASLDAFREAFARAFPRMEVTRTVPGFADADAVWQWLHDVRHEVHAARQDRRESPDTELQPYVLTPQGEWAVLIDPSHVLASDDEALQTLSRELGTVLSFTIETAGGTATFCCFEAGQERRRIHNEDGDVEMRGEPLPQEAGIAVAEYYMQETEALMTAFGLASEGEIPEPQRSIGWLIADHTDYSAQIAALQAQRAATEALRASSRPVRPWWKFWG